MIQFSSKHSKKKKTNKLSRLLMLLILSTMDSESIVGSLALQRATSSSSETVTKRKE